MKNNAEIAAVSVLKIFFEREKEIVLPFSKIIFLSAGVKSPSGPISIVLKLSPFISSFFNIYLEFISAKKSLLVSFRLLIKSLSLVIFDISGGLN